VTEGIRDLVMWQRDVVVPLHQEHKKV